MEWNGNSRDNENYRRCTNTLEGPISSASSPPKQGNAYKNGRSIHPPEQRTRSTMAPDKHSPTTFRTICMAAGYVLSGCSQPLLVALLKEAGLTDPKCQLHIFFNYAMPSLFTLPMVLMDRQSSWPSWLSILKACG